MILVVEDNKTLRLMIVRGLKKEGFEVIEAENGKEALSLLNEIEPEIIISDVRMPEMDGFEFLGKVKELNKKIPFIFLTVLDDIEDYKKGYMLGADSYITKPFEIKDLLDKVKRKLKKYEILKNIKAGIKKEANFEEITLPDIIEFISNEERRIIIEAEDNTGEIFVQNGEIKKAFFGDLEGEKAISKILSLKNGKMKFE